MDQNTPSSPTTAPTSPPQVNGSTGLNGNKENETSRTASVHKPNANATQEPLGVDSEASKAAGNRFFKAKQYEKAIAEYTKGSSALL